MKPFSERNPFVMGAIGLGLTGAIVLVALEYDKLPFINQTKEYSAYFAEAGGLTTGAGVQVSGFEVGQVSSIELDGPQVLVTFTVDDDIALGDRTEAAIKTKGLLGTKILEVMSRGDGRQEGTIPRDRTTSPYQLPDALGDLATTISGLNTNQLSDSLRVVADTFSETPPELRVAVEGVARFSETLNERDAQLRELLTNANKSTAVLAERSDQIVTLVADTNALLAELQSQSAAARSDLGQHLRAEPTAGGIHRREPRDDEARDRQAQRRADDPRQPQGAAAEGAETAQHVCDVVGGVGVVGAVLQELHRQPAAGPVRAAVHRCGVLRPRPGSQRVVAVRAHRPADRHSGSARDAGAVSAHRTGRRPESASARCHHRQPRRSGVRSAGHSAARPHRLLSLPRASSRAAARRATTGTARRGSTRAGVHTHPDAEPGHGPRAR